jgi:hypothetical protein
MMMAAIQPTCASSMARLHKGALRAKLNSLTSKRS